MGRYISTGIVYQYCFEKAEFVRQNLWQWHRKPFSELKNEIIGQMFPKIYDYEEDDQHIYFTLSDSISTDDLISCIKAYYSLVSLNEYSAKELEELETLLRGKTIDDAYELAGEKPFCLFQGVGLGCHNYYGYYAYPLVIDGEKEFYGVNASIIMIDSSSAKTDTEDDLLSYDFFTELLRFRMKPERLADAMIIFLSP